MNKTDIEQIRQITLALYDEPIALVNGSEYLCNHPYTHTIYIHYPPAVDRLDLSNSSDKAYYRREIAESLSKASVALCYAYIQTAFKLTWFKKCSPYLSDRLYAKYLKSAWLDEFNPNMDANVSRQEVIEYFRKAKKGYIMDKDERQHFDNLSDTITIYRGVSPHREKYGLSWTDNKNIALEYMKKFATEGEQGILLRATISKNHVLCYINTLKECELIVDVFAIMDKIEPYQGRNMNNIKEIEC